MKKTQNPYLNLKQNSKSKKSEKEIVMEQARINNRILKAKHNITEEDIKLLLEYYTYSELIEWKEKIDYFYKTSQEIKNIDVMWVLEKIKKKKKRKS